MESYGALIFSQDPVGTLYFPLSMVRFLPVSPRLQAPSAVQCIWVKPKPLHVVPKLQGGGGKVMANLQDDLSCGTSRFGASMVLAVLQDAASVAQGPMEIIETEQKIPSA